MTFNLDLNEEAWTQDVKQTARAIHEKCGCSSPLMTTPGGNDIECAKCGKTFEVGRPISLIDAATMYYLQRFKEANEYLKARTK